MFKAARLAKIKEILIDRNQVDVQTLSTLLDVSSVTVRNDLEYLEQQGYLRRTHGGAILNSEDVRDLEEYNGPRLFPDYDKPRDEIAQIAAQMVDEDEWVFLGPGATCSFIAKHLTSHKHCNIITNSLMVACSITMGNNSRIIVAGGTLDVKGGYLAGELLDSFLDNIHISKGFFSVGGVDLATGYSVTSYTEKSLFAKLKQICDQVIIVADHRKFDNVSFMHIGKLDSVKTVISNENISDKYKEYYFNNGIQLYTSYDIKRSSVRNID